jgi:hypothetical protein
MKVLYLTPLLAMAVSGSHATLRGSFQHEKEGDKRDDGKILPPRDDEEMHRDDVTLRDKGTGILVPTPKKIADP